MTLTVEIVEIVETVEIVTAATATATGTAVMGWSVVSATELAAVGVSAVMVCAWDCRWPTVARIALKSAVTVSSSGV